MAWLRGVDLNHRPLGYEFNSEFMVLPLVAYSSITSLILVLAL